MSAVVSAVTPGERLAMAADPALLFAYAVGGEPEPWQRERLYSTAARELWVTSRQIGKTECGTVRASHVALFDPGSLVLVLGPTQRQADLFLSRCRRTLTRLTRLTQVSTTSLTLENRSQLVSLPGDNPDGIRGYANARLLVVDEAARVSDAAFVACLPMVGRDGQVLALTTPDARAGWVWEAWSAPDSAWVRIRITAHESEQWPPERIERARRELSPYGFRCEVEAEFVGSEHGVFDVDAVAAMLCAAAPARDGVRP